MRFRALDQHPSATLLRGQPSGIDFPIRRRSTLAESLAEFIERKGTILLLAVSRNFVSHDSLSLLCLLSARYGLARQAKWGENNYLFFLVFSAIDLMAWSHDVGR